MVVLSWFTIIINILLLLLYYQNGWVSTLIGERQHKVATTDRVDTEKSRLMTRWLPRLTDCVTVRHSTYTLSFILHPNFFLEGPRISFSYYAVFYLRLHYSIIANECVVA